jgi:hypothetical protein
MDHVPRLPKAGGFQLPEGRLAPLPEDLVDGHARLLLDALVEVEERVTEQPGKLPAEVGLASAHEADEVYPHGVPRVSEGGPQKYLDWPNSAAKPYICDTKNSAMEIVKAFAKLACAAAVVSLPGCGGEPADGGKAVEEFKTEGKISSIVRSPITAEGVGDTTSVAKMAFEATTYDFGEVDEGAVVKHSFRFTNTGKVPLVIQNAHSTCGCTIPDWPKELIEPGRGGEIKVEFNTKGKADFQEKPVIITANTYPSVTKVFVKGHVRKKAE